MKAALIFTALFIIGMGMSPSRTFAKDKDVSQPQCTVAGIVSETAGSDGGQIVKRGNGFAVREDVLLITDHNLVPGAKTVSVTLSSENKKRQPVPMEIIGTIVARDFHTDLAIVKVAPDAAMQPCQFAAERPQVGTPAIIRAFREKNASDSEYDAKITENISQSLEVPGYESALELEINVPPPTLSGSPIFVDGIVVGVVNSTERGLVLAPAAADVKQSFESLYGLFLTQRRINPSSQDIVRIQRNYTFNDVRGSFQFAGLEVEADLQQALQITSHTLVAEGTPHTAKEGTPHLLMDDNDRSRLFGPGFDSISVSGETKYLGYVVAKLQPDQYEVLKAKNPELADRITQSKDNTILIYKIDGKATPNILELLRVLGKASPDYQITEALTGYISQNSSSSDSPYVKSIQDATNLLTSIKADKNVDAALMSDFNDQMLAFISLLSQLQREADQNGGFASFATEMSAQKLWQKMDSAQDSGILYGISVQHRLSMEERAWRENIRGRRPVFIP